MRSSFFSSLVLAFVVAALPVGAMASPKLFYSPGSTGSDPSNTPALPVGGVETVFLFLDPGGMPTSNSGTLCDSGGGNGDETCGVHFRVDVSGDLSIVSFSPEQGIDEWAISANNQTLTVALVTTASPLAAGPTRIGTMDVDTSGPLGGIGQLAMLQTVDADLDLRAGVPRELFQVPEPGLVTLLLPGVAMLGALARIRARRERS